MTANDDARITPATSSIIHILLYENALPFLALRLLVRDLVKYRLPVILALLDASPFRSSTVQHNRSSTERSGVLAGRNSIYM